MSLILFNMFSLISMLIILIQLIRKVFPWFYENYFGPKLIKSKVKLNEMGEWALVTGATDGIGKAYAKALAKQGINVVLVSRSLPKLKVIAKELEEQYRIQTKVIDVDFTNGLEIYEKIEKEIFGLDIGVLVNNVGICYQNPEYFLSLPNGDEIITNLMRCNILSVVHMCKLIMPQMVERNKGVIINISSISAKIPTPMLAIYAATKEFVDKFSEDLATEYDNRGLVIQSVLPGYVATNMSNKKPSWMSPDPDTYVAAALNTVGYSRHTTGYYPHAIMKLVVDTIEVISPTMVKSTILSMMEKVKKRAMSKVNSN